MTDEERAALQAALGHSFREPRWLERALTHRSSRAGLDQRSDDNERLEFLGDAVLSLVVSEYLLAAFPSWDEGSLSKSRARLVNAAALARAAQRLDLGRYLRLGRGEEKTGVRERGGVLADAYEAVVAAIYHDAGLNAAAAFVRRSLLDPAVQEQGNALGEQDYKSALQEWLHARGAPAARYRVVRESGPDHKKRFVIEVVAEGEALATAEGSTKKEAEQSAARQALERLKNRVESGRGSE